MSMDQPVEIAFPIDLPTEMQFHQKVTEWLGIIDGHAKLHKGFISLMKLLMK
jgi:hypothetical protein